MLPMAWLIPTRSELEGGELTANRVLKFVRNLQNEQAQVWARLGDSEARCATLTKEVGGGGASSPGPPALGQA